MVFSINMRTKKTAVVLISGKAGAGKTTVANILIDKLREIPSLSVFNYSFANPIKHIAKAFMKWDEKKDEKGRKLLQSIGQEGRNYNPEIWVLHLLTQMDRQAGTFPFNFVVIDDWRFPNEAAYLQSNPILDIITIRVFGRKEDMPESTASEVSENSLPEVDVEFIPNTIEGNHWYDFQIGNNGNLNELENKLNIVLAEISKQYIVE